MTQYCGVALQQLHTHISLYENLQAHRLLHLPSSVPCHWLGSLSMQAEGAKLSLPHAAHLGLQAHLPVSQRSLPLVVHQLRRMQLRLRRSERLLARLQRSLACLQVLRGSSDCRLAGGKIGVALVLCKGVLRKLCCTSAAGPAGGCKSREVQQSCQAGGQQSGQACTHAHSSACFGFGVPASCACFCSDYGIRRHPYAAAATTPCCRC